MEQKFPPRPFNMKTALQKVQVAEDACNSKDPQRVALAYALDTERRTEAVKEFLKHK